MRSSAPSKKLAKPRCALNLKSIFFGALRVIQAALPLLRRQGSGHILGVSSVAGFNAGPIVGFYHASKWAFEALHESLSFEVKDLGIKVTLLELGAYATGFASQASLKISSGIDAYADLRAKIFAAGASLPFGDPEATADAILKIVDVERPPLRFFVGTEGLPVARAAYAPTGYRSGRRGKGCRLRHRENPSIPRSPRLERDENKNWVRSQASEPRRLADFGQPPVGGAATRLMDCPIAA